MEFTELATKHGCRHQAGVACFNRPWELLSGLGPPEQQNLTNGNPCSSAIESTSLVTSLSCSTSAAADTQLSGVSRPLSHTVAVKVPTM